MFKVSSFLIVALSFFGFSRCAPAPLDGEALKTLYTQKVPPTDAPLAVYFIGHSLVGRDMPAMLAQLAPQGHTYASQLGWGAELQSHWEPDIPIDGSDVENDHPFFKEAHDAVASGDFDVLVMTEKVEIRYAIKDHDAWYYLSVWAEKARNANPDARIYLYETWHSLTDEEGWLYRLDRDLALYWETEIIDRALATDRVDHPIYVIPGGQVMARMARALEQAPVPGLSSYEDLFSDDIHFNDLGAYLIALTHYAVIYGKSPVGLPHALKRADGTSATAPSPEAAQLMQTIVWDVVTSYARSGVQR